jgi:hypothetical protein
MMVSTPGDVPEYELNPAELQFRRGQEVPTVRFSLSNIQFCFFFVPVTSILRTECDFVGDKDGRNGLTLYNIEQGTYVIAKWNGTKVSVKILDRESCSDHEAM